MNQPKTKKRIQEPDSEAIQLRLVPAAETLETPPPAIAFFLQHANSQELAVAYKALVGLLMGEDLKGEEAQVSKEMYLALQREMDRRLHRAIFPSLDSPLPF